MEPTLLIAVCLKPVWRTDVHLRLDEARRGVRAEEALRDANPADLSALGLALRLRAEAPAGTVRVAALSAGRHAAEEALRGALAAGADEVLRVWGAGWPQDDAPLDGTAATTRSVALLMARVLVPRRPALVLAGDRSQDSAHECFGAMLAQALGAAYAHRVAELARTRRGWHALAQLERGYGQELELEAPAVVGVSPRAPRPGYPSLPAWLLARRAAVPLATPDAGPLQAGYTALRVPVPRVKRYGAPGRELTAEERIRAMVSQESQGGGTVVSGEPPGAQAEAIVALLRERGFL